MTAENQSIEMAERESKTIDPSPLTDQDGNVQDLTDASISWVAFDRDSIRIEKTTSGGGITITDAINGKWEISLLPSDTDGLEDEYLNHEARVVDSQGRESVVVTGELVIEKSRT